MEEKLERIEKLKEMEIGLIPDDWKIVRLGEVAEVKAGQSAPQGGKYFQDGKYPFIRVQHIDNNDYKIIGWDLINDRAVKDYHLKLFRKDTIIFPKSGAAVYLEKRAMLPFDAYIVSHLCALNSKSEKLLQRFLFYFLISQKLAKNKAEGYPTLNLSEVKKILIPLSPIEEQKKISYVLSTIQNAKEKTEQIIEFTKVLKKSLMKHLFTYGPVPLDEVDKVKLKETEIGLIPEDWEVVKLGEVVDFSRKPKNLKIKEDEEIPFIPMELIPDSGKYANWLIKKFSEISSGTFILKDDIIVAKITPSFENGKQAIVTNLPKEYGYATTEIWAFHPMTNNVIRDYIFEYLRIPKIRRDLAAKMEGTTGRQRVPQNALVNLFIPLPPLQEQKKIAEILTAIDKKLEVEENKKKALEELFKSMLHNLMTGKIRVKDLEVS